MEHTPNYSMATTGLEVYAMEYNDLRHLLRGMITTKLYEQDKLWSTTKL